MNILDIAILLILGYSLLAGMYKGFIASGLSLLGFVASWFGAYFSYSALMNVALSNSTIMGFCGGLLEAESFFDAGAGANLVSDMAGSAAFEPIAAAIEEKIPLIGEAFTNNVNAQAFAGKIFGTHYLTSLTDYLDQTVWTAVFGVVSFIIMFALIYVVVSMFISLINHVISFPLLRKVDWLAGGIFGLLRGAVITVLAFVVINYVLTMFLKPDSAAFAMINDSKLLGFVKGISFLDVKGLLGKIITG